MSDERPLIFRRYSNGFQPTDEASEAALKSVKLGECIELKIKRPRNLQQHRLFFSLLQKVFENQEKFATLDNLLSAVKLVMGHYDAVRVKGVEHHIPRSIAFHKMPQDEFQDFFRRTADWLCTDVVPGMGKAELMAEVNEMMGVR